MPRFSLLDMLRNVIMPATVGSIKTLREVRDWFVDVGCDPDRVRPVEVENGRTVRYIGEDELDEPHTES